MKIAVSGYVSAQEGSVASANALLLRSLLADGHEVDFFSKPSFVDPRPCVGEHERFRFVSTDNVGPDRFRAKVQKVPLLGFLASRLDCATYERLLLKMMRQEHRTRSYDLCLWLGDYAPGRVKNLPMVSFAQGPPGTDARSIVSRHAEIRRLAGAKKALQWLLLAKLRLSSLGLPPLRHSDHIIVGSTQSKQTLQHIYGVPSAHVSVLPYPIDLEMFQPATQAVPAHDELRVLWLGRIIPRKRLDLFLNGIECAIRRGLNVKATIVGGLGFVPGYEKLIEAFPFPDRLRWIKGMPRQQVPALLHEQDVLIQPSDEENFGSSVSEAQACGLPVIVGHTNGNADYLCSRDVHLADDRAETLAVALAHMAQSKATPQFPSRVVAEQCFHITRVTERLAEILRHAVDKASPAPRAGRKQPTHPSCLHSHGGSHPYQAMNIALISAAYPPDLDGIGDHTYWLARSLASRSNVEVFTRRGRPVEDTPEVKVTQVLDPANPSSFELLDAAIGRWQQPIRAPQWVLLQYNPFGYGNRGWCPWVPATLRKIRRHHPHVRVATMFHETMVPAWPWKFAVMHLWQSHLFRQVCRVSDKAFVSSTRYQQQVARVRPDLPTLHLPVGANIPLDETPRHLARQKIGLPDEALVLGIFGSAHISRQLDWIAAAAKAVSTTGRQVIVAHVGPDSARICQAMPGLTVRSFGEQPADQVGVHLRAMDVMLAPFSDGISTRRGSMMAGLQHGVPVITNTSTWTDRILLHAKNDGLLALNCTDASSFAAMTAEHLPGLLRSQDIGQRASTFYQQNFAWDTTAEMLTGYLDDGSQRRFDSGGAMTSGQILGLASEGA